MKLDRVDIFHIAIIIVVLAIGCCFNFKYFIGVNMAKKIDMDKSYVFADWKDVKSLGITGYFFDRPDSWVFDTLVGTRSNSEYAFQALNGSWYKFFVPEDLGEFKEDESDYKPFTNMKQLEKEGICIGNSFWIRSKDDTEITHLVTVTDITLNKGDIAFIGLGVRLLSTEELFDNYLWCKSHIDNEWRPFGIKNDREI